MKGLPVTQATQDLLLEVLTKQYGYMMALHKAAHADNMWAKQMAVVASQSLAKEYMDAGTRLQEEYTRCSMQNKSVPVNLSNALRPSEASEPMDDGEVIILMPEDSE
jgi:hypothetical protein